MGTNCAQLVFELQIFTISTTMSDHIYPHKYFETGKYGKQSHIRDDLNMYLFHIQF